MEQNLKALLQGEPVEAYDGEQVKPGVICTTAVAFVPREFSVIRPVSYDPALPASSTYKLLTMEYRGLCSDKLPHKALGVRSNEDLLVYKIKKRPVVVLSKCLREEAKGFPAHFADCVLCAPLYTIVEQDGMIKTGYNPSVVERIVALQYRSVFPIPTYPYLDSRICALRFDRIFPTHVELLSHTNSKMSDRWLAYIGEWIHFYATGRLRKRHKPEKPSQKETPADVLATARELLLEALGGRGHE